MLIFIILYPTLIYFDVRCHFCEGNFGLYQLTSLMNVHYLQTGGIHRIYEDHLGKTGQHFLSPGWQISMST